MSRNVTEEEINPYKMLVEALQVTELVWRCIRRCEDIIEADITKSLRRCEREWTV
jgi:hypothetical protein